MALKTDNQTNKWNIGIDFGTSYQYVFGWNGGKSFKNFLRDKENHAVGIADSFKQAQRGVASEFDKENGIGRMAKSKTTSVGANDIKTKIREMGKYSKEYCKEAILYFLNLFNGLDDFPHIDRIESIVVGSPCVTEREESLEKENSGGSKNDSSTVITNKAYRGITSKIISEALYYYTYILPYLRSKDYEAKYTGKEEGTISYKNSIQELYDSQTLKKELESSMSNADKKVLEIIEEENSKLKTIEDKIYSIDEPVLAGYAYFAAAEGDTKGQNLLVVDGGGGTIDIAHIVNEPYGTVRCLSTRGGIGPAGKAVDDKLKNFVTDKGKKVNYSDKDYEKMKISLFEKQDVTSGDISSYGYGIDDNTFLILHRKFKSVDENAQSWVDDDSYSRQIFYVYTDGSKIGDQSDIIESPVKRTENFIINMFPKGNCLPPIDKVLFTGGMSHIADFRDRIAQTLKDNKIIKKDNIGQVLLYPELVNERGASVNEHIKNTKTIGGITLTSSNIVALGACVAASNKYFSIKNENDIYVGTYDLDNNTYAARMYGDVYVSFENGEYKVEFPLFSESAATESTQVKVLENISKFNTDGNSSNNIWTENVSTKTLNFKIFVKPKNQGSCARYFPAEGKRIAIKADNKGGYLLDDSLTKLDVTVISGGGSSAAEMAICGYYTLTIGKSDECTLVFMLKDYIVNIFVMPVKDLDGTRTGENGIGDNFTCII